MKRFIDMIPYFMIGLFIICLLGLGFVFSGALNFSKKDKDDPLLILECEDFSMKVGSSVTLNASSSSSDDVIEWESDNINVAVVNDFGEVNAINSGVALITAILVETGESKSCKVTVVDEIISVSDIKISHDKVLLAEGEKITLTTQIKPENASNKNLIWTSSDENIAMVKNGVVSAIKEGTVDIVVSSSDGSKKDLCVVDVYKKEQNVPVESISFNEGDLSLYVGDIYGINVNVYPKDATNKTITWSSSNSSVVTVDKGIVKAVGVGESFITVKTVDGGKTAKLKVVVREKEVSEIKVSGVSLNSNNIEIYSDGSYNLTAIVMPTNATNKSVTWTSNNPSVATVNNGVVKGISKGTAVITVTTIDGKKTAQANVVVVDKIVPVSAISLNKSLLDLYVNDSYNLVATVTPSNATNKNVTWTSSNPSVATVNNGVVKGVSKGTSVITVKTVDSGKTAKCTVNVSDKVVTVDAVSITLDKEQATVIKGNELSIKATVIPSNATNKNVTWTSNDTDVVKIENGKIKAVGYGTTTVVAKTHNGKVASVLLKVIPNTSSISLNDKNIKTYKSGIILYHPFKKNSDGSSKQSGMQDFDIINFGTNNETIYFVSAVNALTDGVEKIENAADKQELLTAMVFKVPKANLSNTQNSKVMFVDKAGQGQYIAKEPTGNYFWTSGNGGIICSGKDCLYNQTEKKYEICTDRNNNNVLNCTWWGGNNANISRINFAANSYGSDVTVKKYYNYGTIKQKRITMWVTFDWNNNLMAVINSTKNEVYVYNVVRSSGNVERGNLVYQFSLPTGENVVGKSVSTQGYALNGGYLYRLRGNYNDGVWIEEFDMFGNYVDYKSLPLNKIQGNNRAEAQGMKIINNKIYFGIIYRNNCNLSGNNGTCADGTMKDLRNSIYYLN